MSPRAGSGFLLALLAAGCGAENYEASAPAGCDLSLTPYAGDCLRLEAPDPALGFQLHYGPRTYDDPAEVERYVLLPGEEQTDCLYSTTPNSEDFYYEEYHATMRPGTHHMIVYGGASAAPDGTLDACDLGDLAYLLGAQGGVGPGGARVDVPDATQAPENVGLAGMLAPATRIAYQVHYVNAGSEPILRESWTNFFLEPKSEVTGITAPITFIGGVLMKVEPHTTLQIRGACSVPSEAPDALRILSLNGHMHAHGTRFSVWKVDAAEHERLVYETYDWSHPDNLLFDSTHVNPAPDAAAQTGGGASGALWLDKAERIEWECNVENDSSKPLVWANAAYTAEMCNLFGTYTPSLGGAWKCLQP